VSTDDKGPLWQRLLVFIIALAVLGIGIWLLVDISVGTPTAAAFTRVGGETHVETALEASRFWTTESGRVVTVSPAAGQEAIMLGAAQCAMAYDAPLLFRSQDPKRKRAVDATIAGRGLSPIDVASGDDGNPLEAWTLPVSGFLSFRPFS
jgi:hypothetical protein